MRWMSKAIQVCLLINCRNCILTQSDTSDPFEVRIASHKGLGLFATQSIKRGTRLLAEEPLIVVSEQQDVTHIWKELKKLTPEQHNAMSALHYEPSTLDTRLAAKIQSRLTTRQQYSGRSLHAAVEDEKKLHAIFESNALPMGRDSKNKRGLFLKASRINHSCTPNVHVDYNPTISMLTVHATRDINENEELHYSYIPHICKSPAQRDKGLRFWRFSCDCAACEGRAVEAMEKRRRKIEQLFTGLANYDSGVMISSTPKGPAEALKSAEEAVSLLRQHGCEDMELASA